MSGMRDRVTNVGLRDVGFALLCLLGAVLLVPVQLASIIAFDSAGWDTLVPDVVFTGVFPAAVLALGFAGVATRLYSRRRTFIVGGGLFAAYVAVALYVTRFYMLCCGPR